MAHTGLAVIESRWWSTGNDSVRPLFEIVAGIIEDNPHSVRYDMFSEEVSLSNIVSDIAQDDGFHSIYLGGHGDENSVYGLNDNSISRVKLRNIIRSCNINGNVKGIYFGSCLVANHNNASFWLGEAETNLEWVAGYKESVDWVDSSAIDMIFWSKYLLDRKRNRSRKKGKKSELKMVKDSASEMKKLMPSVFNQMGFNIYYMDGGGEVVSVW